MQRGFGLSLYALFLLIGIIKCNEPDKEKGNA